MRKVTKRLLALAVLAVAAVVGGAPAPEPAIAEAPTLDAIDVPAFELVDVVRIVVDRPVGARQCVHCPYDDLWDSVGTPCMWEEPGGPDGDYIGHYMQGHTHWCESSVTASTEAEHALEAHYEH